MTDRESLLALLEPGDFFHAESPRGATLICLVLEVTDTTIRTRRITTQEAIEYDRRTGLEIAGEGEVVTVIKSVAPLPVEVHNIMLWLDRKNRMARPLGGLADFELKALLFLDDHYAANPL